MHTQSSILSCSQVTVLSREVMLKERRTLTLMLKRRRPRLVLRLPVLWLRPVQIVALRETIYPHALLQLLLLLL